MSDQPNKPRKSIEVDAFAPAAKDERGAASLNGPARGPAGPLRSPLLMSQRDNLGSSLTRGGGSVERPAADQTKEGSLARRDGEAKEGAGLNNPFLHGISLPQHDAMVHTSERKELRLVLLFAVVVLLGGLLFYFKRHLRLENLWQESTAKIADVWQELGDSEPKPPPGRTRKKQPGAAKVGDNDAEEKTVRVAAAAAAAEPVVRRTERDMEAASSTGGACRQLLVPSTEGKATSLADRIAVAECFHMFDHPAEAEEILQPLRARILQASEADLNAQKSSATLADAMQLLVASYLRQGKLRDAEGIVRGRCAQWAQTNTCVARAMLNGERRLEGSAMAPLFATQGKLDGKAQARLWLAGATLAANGASGQAALADKRYEMAINAAPKGAKALRKQIYEAYAVDLYKRGEMAKVAALVTRAKADLSKFHAKVKVKLGVLGELAAPGEKRKLVRRLLSREDVSFRARGDIELIDILGPPSLYHGAYGEYLRLLAQARGHYTGKFQALGGSALRRLSLWEVRVVLAQGELDKTSNYLTAAETNFGKSAVLHHLRGVMLSKQDNHARYYLLAAAEFQKALRLSRNWESLHALGVAMLRGGKGEQVALILKDLEKQPTSAGQRYWTDMLKAEWYTAHEKWLSAVKVLTPWVQKQPYYLTPHLLLVDLYRKMGKTGEAEREEAILRELAARPRPETLAEKLGSPLDVLALERRPLD